MSVCAECRALKTGDKHVQTRGGGKERAQQGKAETSVLKLQGGNTELTTEPSDTDHCNCLSRVCGRYFL